MDTTDSIQDKCGRKIDILMKRDLERKLDLQKDQDSKRFATAENEQLEYFGKSFNEKKQQIETALNNSKSVNSGELASHFNNIYKEILTLQKYAAASNMFLRSYDIKIYLQSLQTLSSKAKDLEELLMPKKKFGFKNKSQVKANGVNGNTNGKMQMTKDEVDLCAYSREKLLENTCDFVNESNKSLILKGAELLKKDIALTGLVNCKVKLFGLPSTLHMNSLKNCFIFSGPVSTSIFAENCENCTFVIACQQLRLHSSANVNIYLHVTSRAIMEDCNQVFIAPYNLQYEGLKEDFKESGLDMSANNWTSVDDFNWLNVENKSPHWEVLTEDKRISNWEPYY